MPPIQTGEWIRYDDIIDYYDFDGEEMGTKVRILDKPIYPYFDWMDPETGERIDGVRNGTILAKEYMPLTNPNMIPIVPFAVRLLATQVGMDWKILRPMTVTWWS